VLRGHAGTLAQVMAPGACSLLQTQGRSPGELGVSMAWVIQALMPAMKDGLVGVDRR
jgi:hypothetical protein